MKQLKKVFKGRYELWIVGGSVRDKILGVKSNDIDFATNATPKEMLALPGIEKRTTENGVAHGTVVFRSGGQEFEVTTFRKEVATDGRNATIEFAKTIEEDLARRDLTMNAMAMCAFTGKIVDPFDGRGDIKRKLIRFVGDPKARIQEDHLRILRAYRFLSQMGRGWAIEYDMSKIDSSLLDKLSRERVRDEILKMFKHNPGLALYHMPRNLQAKLFPWESEVFMMTRGGQWHAENVDIHCLSTLTNICRMTVNPLLRLASLLHDSGKPAMLTGKEETVNKINFIGHEAKGAEIVKEWMKAMRFDKKSTNYVTKLISMHGAIPLDNCTDKCVKRFVRKLGEDLVYDIMDLHHADRLGNLANTGVSLSRLEFRRKHPFMQRYKVIVEKNQMFKRTDLKINGNDVVKEGLEGKPVGDVLQALFKLVDEGTIANEREALLSEMKAIASKITAEKDADTGEE